MQIAVRMTVLGACLGFLALATQPSVAQDDAAGQASDAAVAAETESPGQASESELGSGAGAPGQMEGEAGVAVEPSISETTLTSRSYSIGPGVSAGNLEGNACPAAYTMISGACHPGYNDRVVIINQFPNRAANTWRCGFRNSNGTSRTVWIYTLCGR